MSIFKDIIKGIGKGVTAALHFIGHLFAADILPAAIEVTQDFNEVIKSGDAQALVDLLKTVAPSVGNVAQGIVDKGKELAPKVLATELGLQALEAGATAESSIDWAKGVISAYGSADFVTRTKVWNSLATKLAILYDNGRTSNKTWIDWAKTVEAAFQAIQQAVIDQHAQEVADNGVAS